MEKINYKLEVFEGPMDLLLHLITKHKIDIYEQDENWSKTQYNGKSGYVMNSFLKFEGKEEPDQEYDLGERLPLSKGMKGSDVVELQEILLDLDYQLDDKADGIFGSQTEAAIKDFEKDHGEKVDGIVTKGFSDAFEEPTDTDICINEKVS